MVGFPLRVVSEERGCWISCCIAMAFLLLFVYDKCDYGFENVDDETCKRIGANGSLRAMCMIMLRIVSMSS